MEGETLRGRMNNLRRFLVALSGCVLVAALVFIAIVASRKSQVAFSQHATQTLKLNGRTITAEVVSSTADVQQGLSGRTSMPADRGMLFEMGVRGMYPFWMKDMHFPLDIIWIDGDRVVEIAPDLPPPGPLGIPVSYTPTAEADRILEVNAGVAAEAGLKIGDRVDIISSLP